jgi:UDP-N-acetylmuramyl pentapeptide phosphotransferase/UDP-N-acetylglucosamine-1-phosphate transferase
MIPDLFVPLVWFTAFILCYPSIFWVRKWALARQVIDVPDERSSHTQPTPRGAGIVSVVVTMFGLIFCWLFEPVWNWFALLCYGIGAAVIASVSWLDDLSSLPNRIRFAAQSLGAILILLGFGYWGRLYLPLLGQFHLGLLGVPITFLWIVGLTNAYNFMDGIDGIAGAQAMVAGTGWAILGVLLDMPLVVVLGGLLATTSLAFLFHNWPPARIFMGDVGSAFLGYTFACLAVIGWKKDPVLALAGVLLVWPFVFDTAYTFFRRLKNRENVFTPHRSHLYQRLVISGYSHRTVTLLYIALEVIGLFLAVLVTKKSSSTDFVVIVLIFFACFWLCWFTSYKEQTATKIKL